ncbi:MAG: hypothetical protein KC422_08095 [Trueperaceae bacterium]|nr:hypothetical protein [Trueperaceae bacterium]
MTLLKRMVIALLLGLGIFVSFVNLPSQLFRIEPRGNYQDAEALVIMGFGFERDAEGTIMAGPANQFLLDWALETYPFIKLMFVQEAVWRSSCSAEARECFIGDVRLRRIDKHDDTLDLRTMDIAVCSIERMKTFDISRAILVAHDMQLWRTADSFARAKKELCPACEFSVAPVPDSPYPNQSEQWRNRYEWTYKLVDILARVRYHPLIYREIPQTCPSPMPPSE